MISQIYCFVNISYKYLYFNIVAANTAIPAFLSTIIVLRLALRGELLYNKEDMI